MAEVEQLWIGHAELCKLWFGQGRVDEYESRLQTLRQLLDAEQYSTLEAELQELPARLDRDGQQAERLEQQHQKRMYLLKAVRQVCAEMGFKETAGPRYATPGDRRSRILLDVDTFSQGKIAFMLALDGISSHSESATDRCFEQFDEISKYLRDRFEIETEFQPVDGQRPQLIEKGEKDEPDGIERTAEA